MDSHIWYGETMVQDALNAVCEDIDGCESIAFVDLSTRMVLVSNASTPESQDTLNMLCTEAVMLLDTGQVAMAAGSDQLHLFLRSSAEPADALCCICTPDTDFRALVPAAQACLASISGDNA